MPIPLHSYEILKFWNSMKRSLIPLLLALFFVYSSLSGSPPTALKEKKIVVLVPSFNNKDWYQQNLDSIFSQQYENYIVIYIDDHSPDGTGDLVEKYIKEKGQERRVVLIKNNARKQALANRYTGVHLCEDDTIIVDCDGDDMLAHPQVLSSVNRAYSVADVWITWGTHIHLSDNGFGCCDPVPPDVVTNNSFRDYNEWLFSHLRTYYAALFKKIKYEDLQHGGKFIPAATDVAMMLPMLEMAGHHSMYLDEILYIYNDLNQLNLHKTNRRFQMEMDRAIRKKSKYQKLDNLF